MTTQQFNPADARKRARLISIVSLQNMDRNIALILVKIVLTIPVTYVLAYPFLNSSVGGVAFLRKLRCLACSGALSLRPRFS